MSNIKQDIILQDGGWAIFENYLGLKNQQKKHLIRSPFRNDNNPSFSVFRDNERWRFNDFGDPKSNGDCFNLIAIIDDLDIKRSFLEILTIAEGIYANIKPQQFQDLQEPHLNEKVRYKYELDHQQKELKKYFSQFGIDGSYFNVLSNISQVQKVMKWVGQDEKITVFKNLTFKFDGVNGSKLYTPNPKAFLSHIKTGNYHFELETHENHNLQDHDFVVFVAGEKDAICLNYHLGLRVIALQSETAMPSKSLYMDLMEECVIPFSLYDIDETGNKASLKLEKEYGIKRISLEDIVPREFKNEVKDISDYFKCDLSKEKLEKHILNSIYNCKNTKDIGEFHDEDTEGSEVLDIPEQENLKSFTEAVSPNLPFLLKEIVDEFEDSEDKDVVLLSCLTALGGIMDNCFFKYNKGKKWYPTLAIYIIAPAATGKSNIRFGVDLLKKIEDKLYKNYQELLDEANKSKDVPSPKFKSLFLAGNSSKASFMHQLNNNGGKGFLVVTEADTLANANKQEWGNFSDILRNAPEHEAIQQSRISEKDCVRISEPKIPMLITSTPNQVYGVIPNSENGLFSRFQFYVLPNKLVWKDFLTDSDSKTFNDSKLKVFKFWKDLNDFGEIEVIFNDTQNRELRQQYEKTIKEVGLMEDYNFASSVKRSAVAQLRIATILTVIRALEEKTLSKTILCVDQDFLTARMISEGLLEVSKRIYQSLPKQKTFIKPVENREEKFLKALPSEFKKSEAVEIAKKLNIPLSTTENFLRKFLKLMFIGRPEYGKYIKIS